jgi:hypothetical protein
MTNRQGWAIAKKAICAAAKEERWRHPAERKFHGN